MKRLIFSVFSGLLLCYLGGVLKEGIAFLFALTVFSLPQMPRLSPFTIAIGGLLAGCTGIVAGESTILFWGMHILAMVCLSLKSLTKTVALGLMSMGVLRLGTGAEVWLPVFFAAVYNTVYSLTYNIGRNTGREGNGAVSP